MKKLVFSCFFLIVALFTSAQQKSIDQKVDSVLKLMTLDEKIGQMNQYNSDFAATGPITKDGENRTRSAKE